MAGTTKRSTQGARPKPERTSRVKGVKARSTAQRASEIKGTEPQAAGQAPAGETKSPEPSPGVLDEAWPERAQRGEESETSVADFQPLDKGAESVEVALAEDPAKGSAALEPDHPAPIHEEAQLVGRTLLELCMSNPSFRSKVIFHLIRKLG